MNNSNSLPNRTSSAAPSNNAEIVQAERLDVILSIAALLGLTILTMVVGSLFYLFGEQDKFLGYLIGVTLFGLLAFILAARYLRLIYKLPTHWPAFRYLVAALTHLWRPYLYVEKGGRKIAPSESDVTIWDGNLIDRVGGPGYLIVLPGNAVLMEYTHGKTRALSEGRHLLSRFERIKEIIELKEYIGTLDEMAAITQDGIEVKVRRVRYCYRLYCGDDSPGRCLEDPYPFSPETIHKMFYNRSMMRNGLTSWERAIGFAVNGEITNYINKHTLDQLTAPNGGDPRGEIYKNLKLESVRNRMKDLGAELLWCDIGYFDVLMDDVKKQRVGVWQARWSGDAETARAYGKAQRQSYQELGRAEAQAEVLMNIVNALEDLNAEPNPRQNLRNMILMRTAQLLETMSDPTNHDE